MYRLFAALVFLGVLSPGVIPSPDISSYASLHNDLGLPSAQMFDGESTEVQYTIDLAQGLCSDDPADLEPFDSTRLAFEIENNHFVPVTIVSVKLKIRNIVTKARKVIKVKPYSYAEVAANQSGTIQVLLTTISGGDKYYIGTSDLVEAGSYNLKAIIKVRSSMGETTTLKAGLSVGAFDINRCS